LIFKLFQRYQKTWSSISAAEKLRDVLNQAKAKGQTSRQNIKERNRRGAYRRMKLISEDALNQFPLLTRANHQLNTNSRSKLMPKPVNKVPIPALSPSL
jgi:hypothetical protein